MMFKTFSSFALSSALALGAAGLSTSASALTLNTTGLKANATLTFSVPAYYSATGKGVDIKFRGLGNMTYNGDVPVIDPEVGEASPVPQFNLPVTKADVTIGWDLKVRAKSGDSVRSALELNRRGVPLVLANFKVDFDNKVLLCDFIKADGTVTHGGLYSFVEIVPQNISLKGLVLNQTVTIGKLVLTESARNLMGDTLNLSAPLRATLVEQDWGTIAIQVTSYKRSPAASDRPFTAADAAAAR
jgi:hypothetical protein